MPQVRLVTAPKQYSQRRTHVIDSGLGSGMVQILYRPEGDGWVAVSAKVAEHLAAVRYNDDEYGPLMFAVREDAAPPAKGARAAKTAPKVEEATSTDDASAASDEEPIQTTSARSGKKSKAQANTDTSTDGASAGS